MDEHLRRAGFNPRAATVEDDDGAVELSLGLSIGGAPRKAGRVAGDVSRKRGRDAGSGDAGADLGGSVASVSSSSTPPPPPPPFRQWGLDPRTRREVHARLRQEARMKRQEKQQKRGICLAGRDGADPGASAAPAPGFHGAAPLPETAGLVDDQIPMEAQAQRVRARDREAREEERRDSNRRTGEHQEPVSDIVPKPELSPVADPNYSGDANPNPGSSPNFCNPNLPTFGAHPFPALALQYPYPHVQYVPIANGFGFPYMMPCWASGMSPAAGAPGAAANAFQPVACRAFQPFSPLLVDPTTGVSPLGRKVVDSGTGKNTGAKRAPSRTGSLGSNGSSAISDHQSNSLKGGSSGGCSDIRSHPSNVPVERPQPQPSPEASNLGQGQSEHSISSRQIIAPVAVNSIEAPRGQRPPSASTQRDAPQGDDSSRPPPPTPGKPEGWPSVDKPVSAADGSAPSPPQTSPPLPRMPCVSTTGDGPNGKTITGFLYRYTSTEVCIVCVCHGSSFSPAEFVRHAGGTDTGNPLRHIVVIPS